MSNCHFWKSIEVEWKKRKENDSRSQKWTRSKSASLLFQLFTFVSSLNLNGLSSRIRVTSSFTFNILPSICLVSYLIGWNNLWFKYGLWDFKNILTPLYNGPIKAWAVKLNNVPYIIDNRSKTMLLAGGNNVIWRTWRVLSKPKYLLFWSSKLRTFKMISR